MEQNELTTFVTRRLTELHVAHYVAGSIASGIYGESRSTNDIDVIADLRDQDVTPLPARFPIDDFHVSEDAARQAVRTRSQSAVIDKQSFIKVDLILPRNTPGGAERLERRQRRSLQDGTEVAIAAPEDVIVMKLVYFEEGGSERQLRDIIGMLQNNRLRLDHVLIRRSARAEGVENALDVVLARFQRERGG